MEITIEQDKKTILSLQGELGETHAKLLDYESHFSQKVAEVEDQFRAQIHSLMTENTELRRRFMKKCDAYYHLQAEKDRIQRRQVKLLEQKMQARNDETTICITKL
jgi:phage host-nuclease inhibitor protein Gam